MRPSEEGFTLAELTVAVTLLGILLAGAVGLFRSSAQLEGVHQQTIDAANTVRGAGTLLVTYLQGTAASGGDLTNLGDHSFTLRALQGTGVVCARDTASELYGLRETSGYFEATADDSALVADIKADAWELAKVDDAWNGDAAHTGTILDYCIWGDGSSVRPTAAVQLSGPSTLLNELRIGSPIRVFRSVKFGLFTDAGEAWLGRKVGGGSWEKLTGPMLPESEGGLELEYYDASGSTTTTASDVEKVEIVLRAESSGVVRGRGAVVDSVRLEAHLRNNE